MKAWHDRGWVLVQRNAVTALFALAPAFLPACPMVLRWVFISLGVGEIAICLSYISLMWWVRHLSTRNRS